MPEDLPLVDALVQSAFLVQGVMRRVAARHDLSVIQMRLLGILRDREPGTLLLSRILDLDKSSVTGLVDRAEKRGLVERVPDPDDGRAVRIKLTRGGRAIVTKGATEVEAEIETVAEGLTDPQRRQLAGLLSRIAIASPAARPTGPGTGRSPS
jgi:MarR family transcriptional regulator, lower aerobic nicotinate degradation pathway regulator